MSDGRQDGRGRRVLLVDEDVAALRVMELALGERGYDVAAATSVTEAVELIGADRFDAVVSEIVLQGKDGFALLDEVRSRPETATVPFMFLTVDRSLGSKEEGFRRKVDEYVTKPCAIDEFFARLAAIIRRHEAAVARWAPPGAPSEGWNLSGSFSAIGLGAILQELVKGMKEGLLAVQMSAGQSEVYFKGGKIYHVTMSGGEEGADAVGELCAAEHLVFDYRAGEAVANETVNMPIDSILLQLMQAAADAGM
jgi:DNA-binding response OmpR family regulator